MRYADLFKNVGIGNPLCLTEETWTQWGQLRKPEPLNDISSGCWLRLNENLTPVDKTTPTPGDLAGTSYQHMMGWDRCGLTMDRIRNVCARRGGWIPFSKEDIFVDPCILHLLDLMGWIIPVRDVPDPAKPNATMTQYLVTVGMVNLGRKFLQEKQRRTKPPEQVGEGQEAPPIIITSEVMTTGR